MENLEAKASSRAWLPLLARTSAAPQLNWASWHSVRTSHWVNGIYINLFTVAKRKTLFDDRPVEISVRLDCYLIFQVNLHDWVSTPQELTFIIKQDIAHINKQIASLQSYVKQRNAQGSSKSAEGKQIDEHNHNVVMLLQSKLANTSMNFKDVLEVRTQVSRF